MGNTTLDATASTATSLAINHCPGRVDHGKELRV